MSGFDHREAGTPESAWHLDALPSVPMPRSSDRVVVLAAHPDDETLGAGGLIAACAARHIEIDVIVASDGSASHPLSPSTQPEHLARVRRDEVQGAVNVLAPDARLHFLGLPDGQLMSQRALLAERIYQLVPGVTHLVTPWDGDRHPDHEACAIVAAQVAAKGAARHWQYPIWAWHWADPDSEDIPRDRLHQLGLTHEESVLKRRALACHTSQHTPLTGAPGDEAILSAGMLAHFERPFEAFILDNSSAASSAAYFAELYRAADDPWGLADRFYEQRKRQLQLAILPYRRFRRAFEPGCGTGLLTEQLIERCDSVIAWDINERAVEQSKNRLRSAKNLTLQLGQIPADWPTGTFDLIVLSEVGYYCVDLDRLVECVHGSLAEDGVLLACHWRHPAPDHPHTAAAVHRALGDGLQVVASHEEEDFLLHVWSRSGRSVASVEGIVG